MAHLNSSLANNTDQEGSRLAVASVEALNSGDLERWSEYLAEDCQFEAPDAAVVMNKQEWRYYIQTFLWAFPDLHFEINHTVKQDDVVVLKWMATGTHSGPLRTPAGVVVPMTGKKIRVPGSTAVQIHNGKIARGWTFWDRNALEEQLGLAKPA